MAARPQDTMVPSPSEAVIVKRTFYHLKDDLPRSDFMLQRSFSDSVLHTRLGEQFSVLNEDATELECVPASVAPAFAFACEATSLHADCRKSAISIGSESTEVAEVESTISDVGRDVCVSGGSETSEVVDIESDASDTEHHSEPIVDAISDPMCFNWADESDDGSTYCWDNAAWLAHYEMMMQCHFGWCLNGDSPEEGCHAEVHNTLDFQEEYAQNSDVPITTIMIRNIPNGISQSFLASKLNDLGFKDTFDFLYLPVDWGTMLNVGYGFVNFVDCASAARCLEVLPGVELTRRKGRKILATSVAHLQGFEANLEHYKSSVERNSRLRQRPPLVLSRDGFFEDLGDGEA